MTREEAIEVYNGLINTKIKEAFEFFAPELRESEDERVRKWLIQYIKDTHPIANYWNGAPTIYDVLSWLEKQKENPKTADSIPADCASNAKCENSWHNVQDSLPDNGREVLAKDKLGNLLLARYDGEGWDVSVYDNEDYRCHNGVSRWMDIPSENQKEQKPDIEICPHSIKGKSYSETGYPIENCDYGLEIALDILQKTYGKVEGYQTDDGIREHETAIQAVKDVMVEPKQEWSEEGLTEFETAMLHIGESFFGKISGLDPNDKAKVKEQAELLLGLSPKAEWSEEDEATRIEVIKLLSNPSLYEVCEHLREESVDWLKTLHTKVNVNSEKVSANSEKVNVNWSEEDYETINDAIKRVDELQYLGISCGKIREALMLKSLRPHWRPSEEQMKALDKAIPVCMGVAGRKEVAPLESLYNDLKKLI